MDNRFSPSGKKVPLTFMGPTANCEENEWLRGGDQIFVCASYAEIKQLKKVTNFMREKLLMLK